MNVLHFLTYRTHYTTGYLHDTVVRLSVRPSACESVHCGWTIKDLVMAAGSNLPLTRGRSAVLIL